MLKIKDLFCDTNLNQKPYLHELNKKVSRGIGLPSKIQIFCKDDKHITSIILFTYLHSFPNLWANTYNSFLKSLLPVVLQNRAIYIITFSKPGEHSELLFKKLKILKLTDLVTLYNALSMYHCHYNLLPSSFENFFQTVACNITLIQYQACFQINVLHQYYQNKPW